MPREPGWLREMGRDLESPTSRFTMSPAVALGFPEPEWDNLTNDAGARGALARDYGEWLFEEHEELGRGEAKVGSAGRGAEGVVAVLVFIGLAAAHGIIATSAGMAWKRFLEELGRRSARRGPAGGINVSRGGAAYVAVGEVAERFGEPGPVEVEAVEEPSSIAGAEVTELSYVGVEPWVVLLRNRDRLRRYVVVVSPGGEVLGAMETTMGEWEHMFLRAPGQQVAIPRRPQSRWKFWKRRR